MRAGRHQRAVNTKGEGDSPEIHFDDSVYGGDFLANQPPVKAMCYAAPGIISLLDRMGVMFNRTPEGLLDFRRFGGTKHHRTAFAGATTGQQLLYALDEQVRRYEVEGAEVRDVEFGPPKDADASAAASRPWTGTDEGRGFSAMAVMMATGGPGIVFGRSRTRSSTPGRRPERPTRTGPATPTASSSRFTRRQFREPTSCA